MGKERAGEASRARRRRARAGGSRPLGRSGGAPRGFVPQGGDRAPRAPLCGTDISLPPPPSRPRRQTGDVSARPAPLRGSAELKLVLGWVFQRDAGVREVGGEGNALSGLAWSVFVLVLLVCRV